jgi:hypothetical protein
MKSSKQVPRKGDVTATPETGRAEQWKRVVRYAAGIVVLPIDPLRGVQVVPLPRSPVSRFSSRSKHA